MTDRHDREDELLREGFRRVREEEEAAAPSFAALMARARNGRFMSSTSGRMPRSVAPPGGAIMATVIGRSG